MSEIPLAKDMKGMRVSVRGMLNNAANALRKDAEGKQYRYMLKTLCEHLEELAERYYSGDLAVVDEFLQLYDLSADKREAIKKNREKKEGGE